MPLCIFQALSKLTEEERSHEKEKELERDMKQSLALTEAEESISNQLQSLTNTHQAELIKLSTNHEVELNEFRDCVSQHQSSLESTEVEMEVLRGERDWAQTSLREMDHALKAAQVGLAIIG